MEIKHVPLEWVNRTWQDVEKFFVMCSPFSTGDYTVEQMKAYVAQGSWSLLVVVEDGVIHGAITVSFYNRPNDRVALVTQIGGKCISSKETFDQLRVFALSMGATTIEGAARESVARLWRRYGFKEKHRIVSLKLEQL